MFLFIDLILLIIYGIFFWKLLDICVETVVYFIFQEYLMNRK